MGKALYRTYRSRKLSEIVGQDHVTTLLTNAIKTGRIAHAYLFTGPRGVGKTSIARILAHEINQLPYTDDSTHLDIVEIDAASNNGVDDIRELREKVMIAPTSAKYKVYIIDEVHMLSKAAFNALLKTLEEPPEHVVFMLATTDIDKLPETIISRTQRHTFRRASVANLVANMRRVADAEGIAIDDDALQLIAEHADGGYRDSLSLLDQLANSSDGTITAAAIEDSLGLTPATELAQLITQLRAKDFTASTNHIKQLIDRGLDVKILISQLIQAIIASETALLPLVQPLITASQSSFTHASFLAAIGVYTDESAKHTVSLAVSTPVSPAVTLSPLEVKAVQPHPKDDLVSQSATPLSPKVASQPSVPTPAPVPAKTKAAPAKSATSKEAIITKTGGEPSKELDWSTLIAETKEKSIGLFSLLSKCGHETSDATLTIYTKTEFYKKKMSTATNQQILHETLQTLTGGDWEIVLLAQPAPLKDSQAASIAAMMGGGEAVSL